MAKKRITLPSNIYEIIERNQLDEWKAVFEQCDINAYQRGSSKTPALCLLGISTEFIEWLLNNGADIEASDYYGETALLSHVHSYAVDTVEMLLKHGANIHVRDCRGNTVLHKAIHAEMVTLLLAHGADPKAEDGRGDIPLLSMLRNCRNGDIAKVADIAEIYLQQDIEINEEMQDFVTQIGESFEFYRHKFNPEYLAETEQGLQKLYTLFNVTPVTPHHQFDGVSAISVQSSDWQAQFNELWQLLVPSVGAANTVQGEVIRICGKITREIVQNGAVNWSRNYKKLPQALPDYLNMGNMIAEQNEIISLAKSIHANSDEDDLYRLNELAVKWVLHNPQPIALNNVSYDL